MKDRLLQVKRFVTKHSVAFTAAVMLLLLCWGAVGWSSVPKYKSPIDDDLQPLYIQLESHYLGFPDLFLIPSANIDAIGDDIVVPCYPRSVADIFQALYLVEMDNPPSDEENEEYWDYRLTLFYTPYESRLDEDATPGSHPPVTIQIYSHWLSIDGVSYTVPEGCSLRGINSMVFSMYDAYCILAREDGGLLRK